MNEEKLQELQKEVENQIIELDKEERKEPFYRFFVEEYYGTGEGVSVWLQISRNYDAYDGEDYSLQDFKKFIEYEFYWNGIEEKTEEEFMTQYSHLIPSYVVKMVERKDQPQFTWQTHTHINYS